MEEQNLGTLLPYAVNSSIVLVLLVAMLRKPLRKYLYQRHERMKDAFESAVIAHQKAMTTLELARGSVAGLAAEEAALGARESGFAAQEKQEILRKAEDESARLQAEAERLAAVEQEDASEGVKEEFLRLVVSQAEASLRQNLKKDDHSAILKRAQNNIEVGV